MLEADRIAALQTGGAFDGVEDDPMPERMGAYRIVKRIGRGGMGAVYLGTRDTGDFDHSAAIKVIKPGLLSDRLIERFQRERQTLANLKHPNIARLYDGGETPDGAPYIVMEHIEGEPFLEWIEGHKLSRDGRLRLVSTICDAVGHAHANLIVHRDITPSNVLVTEDGQPKLIDFGIAKPASEIGEGSRTTMGSIASLSLTPGYAAPERMAGGEATISGDVYSLGKLLAAVLGPDTTDVELSAIIGKATSAEPATRYATVDALRSDIEAAISAMPVVAMDGGRRYVLGKFVQRHRFGVFAAASALALLMIAFVGTAVSYFRAEAARTESDERFQQTRSIAKSLLFEGYDEVSKVPGSTAAKEKLAGTGLAYLDALAADKDAPQDVRIEAGRGYVRLAQVTGGGLSGQLGNFEGSNTLLGKAEAILKPLFESAPHDEAVARAYAALLLEQARTNLYNNSKTALSRDQARSIQKILAPFKPKDAEGIARMAAAISAEGDTYIWQDDHGRARDLFVKAENMVATLPPPLASHKDILLMRAGNLRLLGEAQHKLKLKDAARATLDRAVDTSRALAAKLPGQPEAQHRLAATLWYRAVVHRTNYRDPEARASIYEAVEIAARLRDRDPKDAGALKLFVVTNEVYAQTLGDVGRFTESFRIGNEVQAAQEKLVALAGNTPGALRSMATSMATDGGNHYNGGDYVGACQRWRRTRDIFLDLEKRGALTDTDRNNGLAEMKSYLSKACENGPPRAGLEEGL